MSSPFDQAGPELAAALSKKGFETLTPVQQAMLDPALTGRDLRVSSQTGSGKTVAIGLAIREVVQEEVEKNEPITNSDRFDKAAHPRAIVVVPTRELAKQVEEELRWLFAGLKLRVVSVTGGSGYRDELRSFRDHPAIVVGTPGRLLDHLDRKSVDAGHVKAVVLDEADRMLDLGFREDLEKIFATMPEERQTHLVSATFPREVLTLANRVQKDPARVEGTPLGKANTDIEHVVHLVHPKERVSAIVNLMLASGGQTLIFARTRADVAGLADQLREAGFTIGTLSGEMEQAERNRALAAFKKGQLDAMVATDVAARGIDVQDVAAVIHAEPPGDADAYTHRSGRTGRAGKKGTSAILVSPAELVKTFRLLGRARVQHRVEPVPSAREILALRDEHLYEELTTQTDEEIEPRARALAERLVADDPVGVVARLLKQLSKKSIEPRDLTRIEPPNQNRQRVPPPPPSRARLDDRPSRPARAPREPREDRVRDVGDAPPRRPRANGNGNAPDSWVPFRISWGQQHGADTRRLMAMLCRRGGIEGKDIGAMKVQRTNSLVQINAAVAQQFEQATAKPDPRDPRIKIRRWVDDE